MTNILFAFCLLPFAFFIGCGSEKKTENNKTEIQNPKSEIPHEKPLSGEKEISRLKKMLKEDPTLWKERHQLGVTYMMAAKYQEAVEEFLGVLSVDPGNVHALQSIGMAYYRMGKSHKSQFYWRSALDIQPDNEIILSLVRMVKGEKAEETEKSKIKNQKSKIENWIGHYKKGQKYYQNRGYEKAVKEFKEALKYNPSDSRTWFSLGVAYNAMNEMKEAVAAWRESLRIKPDDIMVMRMVAMANKKLDREREIPRAKAEVEKKTESADAHYRLAALYFDDKHGNYIDKAEAEFKESIRLNPNQVDSYSMLAEISFFRDRYEEGITYLEEAGKKLSKNSVRFKKIKDMKLYRKLIQKGKEEWEKGGIEKYDEMILIVDGQSNKWKSFYIDKYEVTNAQYKRFLDRAPNYPAPPQWKKRAYRKGKDNFPVVNMDWYMASAYCKAVGKRLPAEQEWVTAAYGMEVTNQKSKIKNQKLNGFFANFKEAGFERLTPAGSFKEGAGPYGTFNMPGNAWEWTATGREDIPDCGFGVADCEKVQNSTSFPQGNYKIRLGGSFKTEKEKFLLGKSREFTFPTHTGMDVGFRCAKDDH